MNSRFLYATLGHTAAGKTTLSKYLLTDKTIDFIYIEEGQIKRDIVGNYSTNDSLNEKLRDEAYGIAIERAAKCLDETDVLIDASFHRLERRKKVYAMIRKNSNFPEIIWLYCYCPNFDKVEDRISRRKRAVKKAETQADSMRIYNHIMGTFNVPEISEIPLDINGAIIYINSDINEIERIEYNSNSNTLHDQVEKICCSIHMQQGVWRNLT